jgi:FkbM family methyltransferase
MSATKAALTDEEVIRTFPCYEGPGEPGYITDFLGTKTRLSSIPSDFARCGGLVEGYPIKGNFHSGPSEWAGVLRAVLDAQGELVAVELGAGWAPWLVIAARAARMRGIESVHLVGVEGAVGHLDFMRAHFADNGLDPDRHTLLHGVVGAYDGVAKFPVVANPAAAYGGEATFAAPSLIARPRGLRARIKAALPAGVRSRLRAILRRGAASSPYTGQTERVPCFSLATILHPFREVDLVHIDIQGAEYDVLASARRVLKEKVKRVVIGTHGRLIEHHLLEELASQSWILESEVSCVYVQQGMKMNLFVDGCQTWRNPDVRTRLRLSA